MAAKLYHEGYAPLIVPSGGVSVKSGVFPGSKSKQDLYPGPYKDELSFLTDVLRKNGVPEGAILGEPMAGTTTQNAQFSRDLLDRHQIKIRKGIVVCKSFHARRAKMYYAHAFPEAMVMAHPFPYVHEGYPLTRETWTQTPAGIKRVLGEVRRVGDQFTQQILDFCLEEIPGCQESQLNLQAHPKHPSNLGQLHHVEIYVSHLDTTKDFWGWLLPLLGYKVFQEWDGGISYIHKDTYLVFVQVEAKYSEPPYHRSRVGLNHLAFYAPDRETIDGITEALKARGHQILYPDRHPYAGGPDYYAVYFEDPDRIKVEVAL